MANGLGRRLFGAVQRTLGLDGSRADRVKPGRQVRPSPDRDRRGDASGDGRGDGGVAPPSRTRAYPGDFRGVPAMSYAPEPDGQPDPGEIVWTWVPFEEDHSIGKDRPVLLVGSDGDWLLGVMLTSKNHDRDVAQERRAGRDWVDIGSGGWDRAGRPSEVRIDRIIRVDPATVRREGSVLGEDRFLEVADAIRREV